MNNNFFVKSCFKLVRYCKYDNCFNNCYIHIVTYYPITIYLYIVMEKLPKLNNNKAFYSRTQREKFQDK